MSAPHTAALPRHSLRFALALAAVWAGWPATPVTAQFSTADIWQSTGTGVQDTKWSNANNWNNGPPGQNSDVQFATSGANVLSTTNDITPAPLLINSLSVLSTASGPVSIGGNALSVNNAINVVGGNSLTISAGLGTSPTSTSNLAMNGPGTLTITTAQCYVPNGQVAGGTLNVNTTFNGNLAANNNTAAIGGNGTITGNLTENNGAAVSAGTGVGASTLTVGGSLTLNGPYNVTLFGTGYTNANNADISRIAAGGGGTLNNVSVLLDLSQIPANQINSFRTASMPFHDYNIITSSSALGGAAPSFTITNLGNFSPGEWSIQPFVGGTSTTLTLRFTPVPEPAGVLAVCGVAAIAAVRPLRARKRA